MNQIKGFSEYGFPESHAASFALLVYASAWIKTHYPVQFVAALLNSQPMGFYAPAQIINDLTRHGFDTFPVDIRYSDWDCKVTEDNNLQPALRLGLRMIKGLSMQFGCALVSRMREFSSETLATLLTFDLLAALRDVSSIATLELLAKADAFCSFNLQTRDALWAIKALAPKALPLEAALHPTRAIKLPEKSTQQSMFDDFAQTGLSLKAHPLSFIRAELLKIGVVTIATLRTMRSSKINIVKVAGIAFIKQRPGTAKGMVFVSLEDETGITNLVIKPQIFERYRREILLRQAFLVHGILERVDAVTYINTQYIEGLDAKLQVDNVDLKTSSYSY